MAQRGAGEAHVFWGADKGENQMNEDGVPTALRGLIPLAERWGIGDDYERTEAVKTASTAELRALVNAMDGPDPVVLEEWLAGPSASSPDPSAEYLAFTCLLMAADQARLELARR